MTYRENSGESAVEGIILRAPSLADGKAVQELILNSPPLDLNSSYCYFLLCSHYADTCVVAEQADVIVGFLSAYLLPQQPDILFIWQMAVATTARGQGLAARMLIEVMQRHTCRAVHYLETTISPTNHASRRVFQRFAEVQQAGWLEHPFLTHTHFGGESHDEERLIRIGPFNSAQ